MVTSRWQELYSQKTLLPHTSTEKDECIDEELTKIQDEIHSRLNGGAYDKKDALVPSLEQFSSNHALGQQVWYDENSALENKLDSHLLDSEEEMQADLLLKELDDIIREEGESQTILEDFGIDSILHRGEQISSTTPTLMDDDDIPQGANGDLQIQDTISCSRVVLLKDEQDNEILWLEQSNDEALKYFMRRTLKIQFQAWHRGTVLESKVKQFLESRASLHLNKMFTNWWILARNTHARIINCLKERQRKTLESVFCAWANEIWSQIDETKKVLDRNVKRRVLQKWIDNLACKKASFHFCYGLIRRVMKEWKGAMKENKRLDERHNKRKLKIDSFLNRLDRSTVTAFRETIHNDENEQSPSLSPSVSELRLSEEHRETTCHDSSQKKAKSGVVKNGKVKRISKRRPPLKQKNIQGNNERLSSSRRDEKDELERQRYVTKKKGDLQKKKMMQESLHRARQGIKLARVHFSLSLLRRYMCSYWGGYIKDLRIKHQKALLYWSENIIIMCMDGMRKHVQVKKQDRLEKERVRFLRADEYYGYRLCELVLCSWRKISSRTHVTLPRQVKVVHICHTRYRLLVHWQRIWRHKKLQEMTMKKGVVKRARLNSLKRFWMFWKESLSHAKKRKVEEAAIAAKWNCVKLWLENSQTEE